MSIYEVKRRYEGKISVLGGVDVDKLVQLPEEELRNHVRNLIRKCAPGGAFALGSGNTITNYLPLGNYLTMLDEGLGHGKYPIRMGVEPPLSTLRFIDGEDPFKGMVTVYSRETDCAFRSERNTLASLKWCTSTSF